MTIEFGAEIEVNGKRPKWLAGDVMIDWEWGWALGTWHAGNGQYDDGCRADQVYIEGGVSRIRLPADHFAYVAIAAGFEPYNGDSAPDDWDGERVLLQSVQTEKVWSPAEMRPYFQWRNSRRPDCKIIGYRKKVASQPQPVASDTVTIARMTEADARTWLAERCYMSPEGLLRDLGIIRDETPIERFARITGIEVTDANRVAVEAALGFRD